MSSRRRFNNKALKMARNKELDEAISRDVGRFIDTVLNETEAVYMMREEAREIAKSLTPEEREQTLAVLAELNRMDDELMQALAQDLSRGEEDDN